MSDRIVFTGNGFKLSHNHKSKSSFAIFDLSEVSRRLGNSPPIPDEAICLLVRFQMSVPGTGKKVNAHVCAILSV